MSDERCPHCEALNTRVADPMHVKGVDLVFDYCGLCGRNWDAPVRPDHRPKVSKAEMIRLGDISKAFADRRVVSLAERSK